MEPTLASPQEAARCDVAEGTEVSPFLYPTAITTSSATFSPSVGSLSIGEAAVDASTVPGRKRRLSFKEKQRLGVGRIGGDVEGSGYGGRGGVADELAVSPPSMASSLSLLSSNRSPGREGLPMQPALRNWTAAPASSLTFTSPPTTTCMFTALEPRNRRAHAAVTSTAASAQTYPLGRVSPALSAPNDAEERMENDGSFKSSAMTAPEKALPVPTFASLQVPFPKKEPARSPTEVTSSVLPSSQPAREASAFVALMKDGATASEPISVTVSSTESGCPTLPDVAPSSSSHSTFSATSPKLSFKDRQRASMARKLSMNKDSRARVGHSPVEATAPSASAPLKIHPPGEDLPALEPAPVQPTSPPPPLKWPCGLSAVNSLGVSSLLAKQERFACGDAANRQSLEDLHAGASQRDEDVGATNAASALSCPSASSGKATAPAPVEIRSPTLPSGKAISQLSFSRVRWTEAAGPSVDTAPCPGLPQSPSKGEKESERGGQRQGDMQNLRIYRPLSTHEHSCSAGTAPSSPGVEAGSSPLGFTQNESKLRFFDPDGEAAPEDFRMAIPHQGAQRRNTVATASPRVPQGRTGSSMETSASRTNTTAEGTAPSGLQTFGSLPGGASEGDIMNSTSPFLGGPPETHNRTDAVAEVAQIQTPTAPPKCSVSGLLLPPPSSSAALSGGPPLPSQPHPRVAAEGSTSTVVPGIRSILAKGNSSIANRWRGLHGQLSQLSLRNADQKNELASTYSGVPTEPSPELSVTVGDDALSRTARGRRRARDKMLALDVSVPHSPLLGRRGHTESSGFQGVPAPGLALRSYTVDDISSMGLPSSRPGSVAQQTESSNNTTTTTITTNTTVSGFRDRWDGTPTNTGVTKGNSLSSSSVFHAMVKSARDRGPLTERSSSAEGPPLPLYAHGPVHVLSTASHARSSSLVNLLGERSVGPGGVSVFSAVDAPTSPLRLLATAPDAAQRERPSRHLISLSLHAALSTENDSGTSPSTTGVDQATTVWESEDDRGVNPGQRPWVVRPIVSGMARFASVEGGGGEDDVAEDSDNDLLLHTVNSHYGGDSVLNATTAELRKLRRRSTYSSLHYGTMTSYHHRRHEHHHGSDATSPRGRRHGGKSGHHRRQHAEPAEAEKAEALQTTHRCTPRDLLEERGGAAGVQEGEKADCMEDGGEDEGDTVRGHKSGDSDREEGVPTPPHCGDVAVGGMGLFGEDAGVRGYAEGQRRFGAKRATAEATDSALCTAVTVDEGEDEEAQRRTVGMWSTVEHVFLPRYEVALEAASNVSLTGPASPTTSMLTAGGAPSADGDSRHHLSSPTGESVERFRGAAPATTPGTLLHPSAAGEASPSLRGAKQAGSPPTGTTNSSPLMQTSASSKNGLSVNQSGTNASLRPSGLVVLPDVNSTIDAMAAASFSYNNFRRCANASPGPTRLEPESFTFGTVASVYGIDPVEEEARPQGACDAKVAARLVFDATDGVLLMDPEDEVGRYQRPGHTSPEIPENATTISPCLMEGGARTATRAGGVADEDEEGGDGACHCERAFIEKDYRGPDCSRYDANQLYDRCSRCHRRPASFLCLHCLEAVCPSHVRRHHALNPSQCTLFLNLLDIMSSFDRIFWCEKCRQFTWKYTEVYDPLVDQIAYTRGTYLKQPARDIHCVGYEIRLNEAAASPPRLNKASLMEVEGGLFHVPPSSVRGSATVLAGHEAGMLSPQPLLQTLFPSSTRHSTAIAGSPLRLGASSPASWSPGGSPESPRGGLSPYSPATTGKTGLGKAVHPSSLSGAIRGESLAFAVGRTGLSRHSVYCGTPQVPVMAQSPMQQFLERECLDLSVGNTVAVGEPVTKLCALGASVQGWRTTQEDAEAVFLVDIPAISDVLVHRKILRASTAAKAASATTKGVALGGGAKEDAFTVSGADHGDSQPLHGGGGSPRGHDTTHSQSNRMQSGEAGAAPSHPPWSVSPLGDADEASGQQGSMTTETVEEAKGLTSGSNEPHSEATATTQDTIPMAVFCIFDGHGGDAVAKLAARHFEAHLRRAIDRARPDDIRARALLFYLKKGADSALGKAAPWLPPSLTAVPSIDGGFHYVPSQSIGVLTDASTSAMMAAVSSSTTSKDLGQWRPVHSVPCRKSATEGYAVPLSSNDLHDATNAATPIPEGRSSAGRSDENADDTDSLLEIVETVHTPAAGDLYHASVAGSLPVVMPVTAESLRLHLTGCSTGVTACSPKDSAGGVDGGHRAEGSGKPPDTTLNPQSLLKIESSPMPVLQRRRSATTFSAWDTVEEPLPDRMAASHGAASPLSAMFMSSSAAGIEGGRRGSGPGYPAAMAQGCASTTSPAATASVVSIPEMEMLRSYFASIMEDALLSLDEFLHATPEGVRGDYDCMGCTACVVGITANFVLCANIGDSGAAFYTKDRMKVISVKHRVSDEAEQARIHAAGYSIMNGRIEGMSAVPRALGDFDFKQCGGRGPREQAVSAVPDVTIMPVPNDTNQWGIVLACDGVWDTATLHQVHVALTNTANDLAVAGSATEAVLRGADLYRHRLRGPALAGLESPRSCASPMGSPRGVRGIRKSGALRRSASLPLPCEGSPCLDDVELSRISFDDDDEDEGEGGDRRLVQVDAILLAAAAGVFAQCVAPEDNDEGIGLDNCSLIVVERRNVQE